MARDAKRMDGLLPSLFWRIDEAEQSADPIAVSLSQYKADVLRNLRWILNSSCRPEYDVINDFEEAKDSLLNYGIPATTGKFAQSVDIEIFIERIKTALMRFEPRIIKGSLEVEAIGSSESGVDIGFTVKGEIWCEPLPERFNVETFIDSDSGEWSFK